MGHGVESPNPDDNLLERILSRENLLQAWKRVKANKGAAGIDGMSIEAFPELAREHWEKTRESLFAATYQPSPAGVGLPPWISGSESSHSISRAGGKKTGYPIRPALWIRELLQ